ncbi:ABC transporter ATP-binding protein/permease [Gloeobacter violaceus]|uniref:HlyB/MsbA family ABC transporter n=1 Tax=Gloeobacter violaceus (strain ATCC 29082 / PCC 7421) TaxID=251221 RepID=Q7NL26_GLOVI|nr:ABC transporter ATP-binding protein [Gloeobacter violaceus]BAC89241.1 HlyB/MsbA family ABC transporter [Gloeobacter violaceus PCC 7421]
MMLQRRLLALTRGARVRLAATAALGLAATGTYIVQGLLTARAVDQILRTGSWSSILDSLGGIAACIVLRIALVWLREVSAVEVASAVKQMLRTRLFNRLLLLGPGYLETKRTGAVQATVVDSVEALEGYMGYYLPQVCIALCAPALIVSGLFALDPVVGALTLGCVLVAPFGPTLYDWLLGDYGRRHWQAYSRLGAQFLDSMQGMTTLKAFNASGRRGLTLQREATDLYRATMAQMSLSLVGSGIAGLALSAGTALAVGVGALHLAEGSLNIPGLLTILFLSAECFRPLADLNMYWHLGYRGISASPAIFELLEAQPMVSEPADSASVGSESGSLAVAFENVTFAYTDGERPALGGLSFEVGPGETVALVGRSGAGKSTVVSLLFRFFDPQSGRITLAGREIREYSLESLRSLIAVVPQETYLFHGTVAENLRFGRRDATPAQLEAAARTANAHDFIAEMPEGYQTIVGERGLKLSGGQRQRIAIARALLKDAPLLILDEATSSVDAANEAQIQQALERLRSGRTTLVIAHRLSTVVNADHIVVLEQGQAVQAGRHRDLLLQPGAYARLVTAQQGTL